MAAPGDTLNGYFLTENTSGQAANADSLPTVTIRRNGSILPDSVTVTNPATGEYAFAYGTSASWSAGDLIVAVASVVIAGATYTVVVGEWTLSAGATVPLPTTTGLPGTRDEWRFWPNLETVTLRVVDLDGYTEHAILKAKRRAVQIREQAASGGAYVASDLVWLIPNELLPAGVTIKPADVIRDAASVDWTVLAVQPRGKFGNTWRVTTRSLVLVADLRTTCDQLRPSLAQDAAGQRAPVFAVIAADVPCKLMELEHAVLGEYQGGPTDRREYTLYVGSRLTLRAGDVIDVDDVRYDVVGAGNWDRIDQLGEVRLVKAGTL